MFYQPQVFQMQKRTSFIGTKLILLLACLCPYFFAQTTVAQSQSASWNLSKGEQFKTVLNQESVTKTKVDSRETSVISKNEIVMGWNVTDVAENGDATIEQAIESIKLDLGDPALPAKSIQYDTAGDNSKISKSSKKLLEQVQPLIGLKFEVVMSKLGEIKTVSLPETTSEAINQLPDALNLRSLFTEKGLKDILGAASVVLPKEEFEKDESWTDESKVMLAFGAFNRKRTYTYLGNRKIDDREFAEFKIDSSMERLPSDEATASKGKLLSFAGTGTLMLDLERGFFSSCVVNNEAKTEAPYREKKMNTVVTNEITMTISKK